MGNEFHLGMQSEESLRNLVDKVAGQKKLWKTGGAAQWQRRHRQRAGWAKQVSLVSAINLLFGWGSDHAPPVLDFLPTWHFNSLATLVIWWTLSWAHLSSHYMAQVLLSGVLWMSSESSISSHILNTQATIFGMGTK